MRAVVISTGRNDGFRLFSDRHPIELFPLAGRPFLQHAVEVLVQSGFDRIDFVVSHLHDEIREYFGDGKRWGSRFGYRLAPSSGRPYSALRECCGDDPEPFLLVHGDRIPNVGSLSLPPETALPLIYCRPAADSKRWTGWAWLTPQQGYALPVAGCEAEFGGALLDLAQRSGTVMEAECRLSLETCHQYLSSQEAFLQRGGPELALFSGRESAPGIWLSRNVDLHPSARLRAPVYIGPNCRIGRGVSLGPNAVVSENCVVDAHSKVVDSVVLPGTYIGEALELDHTVADRNRLANVRLGTEVVVTDAFLLGPLAAPGILRWLGGLWARAVGAVLLLAASPVLAATAAWLAIFRPGPVLSVYEAVRLPAEGDPGQWRILRMPSFRCAQDRERGDRSFLLDTLPALVPLVNGKLRFFGVAPRSRSEVLALEPAWRHLYLRSSAGLITFGDFSAPAVRDADEADAAEELHVHHESIVGDLSRLGAHLQQSAAIAQDEPVSSDVPVNR